jgi:hypothetical protein
VDIIREIGHKHFGFLPQGSGETAAEPVVDEALDPSEFVQSYTTDKYKKEIKTWNKNSTPGSLIDVLKALKAPKTAYVEIGVILAEEVLPVFEKEFPKDLRPRKAIEATRAWLKDSSLVAGDVAAGAIKAADEIEAFNKGDSNFKVWNTHAKATHAAKVAAFAAWSAFASSNVGLAISSAHYATIDAIGAGLTSQHAMDVVREVGGRYFSFLTQGSSKKVTKAVVDEALDPAEFVQSYNLARHRKEIETWGKVYSPMALINVLHTLKAPQAAFVQISIALAEEALPKFEKKYPKDLRPRKAIEAAKAWLKDGTTANADAAEAAGKEAMAAVAMTNRSSSPYMASRAAARAAAQAAYITCVSPTSDHVYAYADATALHSGKAGVPKQRAMDIIREVGHAYFGFLAQGSSKKVAEADETLDSAEFVKSYTTTKYQKEIEAWNKATTPDALTSVLKSLKAPKAARVEISAALAGEVLSVFENTYPGDLRPRKAIKAAKAWLQDKTTANALLADAAADAADEAAWTAYYAACAAQADVDDGRPSCAAHAAWAAWSAAQTATYNVVNDAHDAANYALKAGLSNQRIMDIVKDIGEGYFSFLIPGQPGKVVEAGEALDPSEFVKSYHTSKYKNEIKAWGTATAPNTLIDILERLKASKNAYTAVSAALAEEVLPAFEKRYPADPRPRQAVEAAKDWLEGKIVNNANAAARAASAASDARATAYDRLPGVDRDADAAAYAAAYAAGSTTGSAYGAYNAVYYAVMAGLPQSRAVVIIKEVGEKYFSFLGRGPSEGVAEVIVTNLLDEVLDPAEFVRSYTTAKYQKEIAEWNKSTTPEALLYALKSLKAPREIFVEICLAFAEEALPIFESKFPEDLRPRKAIKATKAWLRNRTVENARKADRAAYASDEAASAAIKASAYAAVASAAAHAASRAAWSVNSAHDVFIGFVGNTTSAATCATEAGISNQRAMDIVREVGHRYFSFLDQGSTEGVAEAIVTNLLDETLDPAEFVKSYTTTKYQDEIEDWNRAITPKGLIDTLTTIRVPGAVFVEISIALAEKTLPAFERTHPKELKPRKTLEAAKAWLKNRTSANARVARAAADEVAIGISAANGARAAAWAAYGAAFPESASLFTAYAVGDAVHGGLTNGQVMDIVREIGHRYFSFLARGSGETNEALDPSEFVRSYNATKYREEIIDWTSTSTPKGLIFILKTLNAPKAAFVEIGIALAEEALPIFEKEFPEDLRPRKALEIAKAWLKDQTEANAQAAADAAAAASTTWWSSDATAYARNNAASAVYEVLWIVGTDTTSRVVATANVAYYATKAGLLPQRVFDVVRKIGEKYFSFLGPDTDVNVVEASEALDPAEFVQSYTLDKYRDKIEIWNKSTNEKDLLYVLRDIGAPKTAYVEIGLACAEGVLPAFEKKYPGELRPRQALEALRTWLKDPSPANAHAVKAAAQAADAAAQLAAVDAAKAEDAAEAAEAAGGYYTTDHDIDRASWAANAAANAAWIIGVVYTALDAIGTVYYATKAGLPLQRALDIVRGVGAKYFSFLGQGPSEKVAEAHEMLDPSEFVKYYHRGKYREEIGAWNETDNPEILVAVLRALNVPKVAYAEISVALAEKVLPVFEKRYPNDPRPRQAVEAAKTWLGARTVANAEAAEKAIVAVYAIAHITSASASVIFYAARVVRNAKTDLGVGSTSAYVAASEAAGYAAHYAVKAGIFTQEVIGIIKEVGHKYFSFLGQGTTEGMSEAIVTGLLGETLDPSEFVKSYTLSKYQVEIEVWNKASIPKDLTGVLQRLKAPKAAYVEFGIAVAEEVLSVFEKRYPNDPRPRQAIEAAKTWLNDQTEANALAARAIALAASDEDVSDRPACSAHAAANVAWSAASYSAYIIYSLYAMADAARVGLPRQRIMDIGREIGHKYFSFLGQGTDANVTEALDALDPSAFFQSYTLAKYKKDIKDWGKATTSEDFIRVLHNINAPKAAFVEIGIACSEELLPMFEKNHPGKDQPRNAVEAAKAWLKNQTTANAKAARFAAVEAREFASDSWATDAMAACVASAASEAAAAAAHAPTPSASGPSYSAVAAGGSIYYAMRVGLSSQSAANIVKEVGKRYIWFLNQDGISSVAETAVANLLDEALDPAEFVKSYTLDKYSDEIETWNKATTTTALINVLKSLKSPGAAFVEISAALAEEVLPVFEKAAPNDLRPRKAVEVAKDWLKGRATGDADALSGAALAAYEVLTRAATAAFDIESTWAAVQAADQAAAAARAAAWTANVVSNNNINADARDVANVVFYSVRAGLHNRHVMSIVKKVGEKYFSFLSRGSKKRQPKATPGKLPEDNADQSILYHLADVAKYSDRWHAYVLNSAGEKIYLTPDSTLTKDPILWTTQQRARVIGSHYWQSVQWERVPYDIAKSSEESGGV